jgi:2-desacetyl-2-hydroxyethyl bacteriochlorophyllide A dehydrogenase
MRAAVLEGSHRLVVREARDPCPHEGEVVVAVELAGVCGSDVALYQGKRPAAYPLILGHEAIGRVVDAGRSELLVGARVAIEPNIPCGACAVCRRGRGNVCPSKRSLGLNWPGVFADLVAVPADFVHALPPSIGPTDAVGLEPLAVAVHAFRVGEVGQDEAVAVIGCGTEGLLLTQVAVAMGAQVLAADVRSERLTLAARLGATRTFLVPPDEPVEAVAARMAAEWCPVVIFESAGTTAAVDLAVQAVAVAGRIVLVGLGTKPVAVVPVRFVRRGLSLLSSLIYDHPGDFAHAIELLEAGLVHPSALVTHTAGLDDAPRTLHLASTGATGKAVLDISGAF